LASFDTGTGSLNPWDPNANGTVYALSAQGARVFAGGTFSLVGGQTRNNLAALDATGAAEFTWDPNMNGGVYCVSQYGYSLFAGGSFSRAHGLGEQGMVQFYTVPGTVGVGPGAPPPALRLASTPNPARVRTTLRFRLNGRQEVTLGLFDAAGRRVRSLLDHA